MLVNNFLENSALRFPDKIALICGNEHFSYQQINDSANRFASALINLGVGRQDRVLIFLDNSAESVISLFGILKAGGIFVMPNATMKIKKLNYIIKDTSARILITHKNKARIINGAVKDVADLDHIIWIEKPGNLSLQNSINSHLFDEMISNTQTFCFSHGNPVIDVDLATLIYTSGSTGDPKGIMSAHYNVVSAVRSITSYLKNVESDIILNTLPLSFDYGLYQIFMAFLFGGTVVLEKSFAYPYKVLQNLVEKRVTGFPIVPTMAALLLQIEDLSKFDFSSIRYISNTAAVLQVPYIQKLQKIFPDANIYSMYGLSECKRVSYLPPEDINRKPESVGIPMPNEEVFIVDKDGNKVGPNVVGELVVRGSNVMQGYWNDPEETAKSFRSGRYKGETLLYTKDLFKKDEEDYLYFIARKDNLIKTKGERISPKEIENVLCEIDGVIDAAVIGVPDEVIGQAIKAFVQVKGKSNLTEKKVFNYCMKNLEPFMLPKWIEFVDTLPKLSTGKINIRALK